MAIIKTCKDNFKLVPTEKLIPHPRNNNRHSIEQLERLAKIIEHRGFREPLTVSKRSGFVVCGHARLEAAKILGMSELPAIYQDFESEAEEYSHMTADNEIARWAELDLHVTYNAIEEFDLSEVEIDLLGIENFSLPEVEVVPECDEDHVPEIKPDPITKRGDVWLLGNHRVMCGDSTMIDDVEKLMNGEKADMVFTDPPYGIGIDGQKESISKNPKQSRKAHEFRGWDSEVPDFFQNMFALNIPSIVFGANYMSDKLPPSRGWIVWGKGQDGQLTASDGELAWTNQDKPLRVVTCNRANIGKSVHPTQKPLQVVEFCLNYVDNSETVIDFFLGSGSTLIACEKTTRVCYGMELDEKYCDVILQRFIDYTGNMPTLESTGESFDELRSKRKV